VLLTAVLAPAEEAGFIAFNPETGTTTQGETLQEAINCISRNSQWWLRLIATGVFSLIWKISFFVQGSFFYNLE
jgi:hypothetical protein